MKLHYYFLLLLFFYYTPAKAQYPQAEFMRDYSIPQLEALADDFGLPQGLIPFNYELDVWKITYETPDPQGSTTIATGALVIPKNPACYLPLASYQHGTVARKDRVPSAGFEELNIGLLYSSSSGYIVSMPDYIGLGDSPGMHPYVHAESQATATVDMIRSSISIAENEGINWNGQLFLYGYSQGGHATMATHKYIQENLSNEFQVTASNPMSGPYDMSGVQAEVVVSDQAYSTPAYLPYVLLGYQRAYPNLFSDPSQIFKAPYDQTIPPLFDGTHSLGEINAAMPSVPNQILIPEVLDSFRNDPNHRLRIALRDNDLYNWTPEAPVRMSYCTMDEQVNFQNAIVARDSFLARGASNIEAINLGGADHRGCASPALLGGIFYFSSYKVDLNGMEVTTANIYNAGSTDNGAIALEVTGGIPPLTYSWENNLSGDSISNLSPGFYGVTISDATGCSFSESYFVGMTTSTTDITTKQLQVSPNPANSFFSVELPEAISVTGELRLLDVHGKVHYLQSGTISPKTFIPVEYLPSGMYIVEWRNKESRLTAKIMVQ